MQEYRLHRYPPFNSAREARDAVGCTRAALDWYFSDSVIKQELLLVVVCAKALAELSTDGMKMREGGERPFDTPEQVGACMSTAFRWLQKITKEPWPETFLPREAYRQIGAAWGKRSVLRSVAVYHGSPMLQAIFAEIAAPSGGLLQGSRFSREQTRMRLLDAIVFKTHSKRFHAVGAAAAKGLGLLSLLKQRNLDYMRGNHKRGDLVLSNYPKLIHVELATACNLRCRTCSITRPGRDRDRTFIKFETLRRLRPALAFISDCKLHGGGEPFLHPQIEQVLEIFRDEGVRLNTVTNANLINERLGRLIGETFATLTVSVDGSDKET